MYTKPNTHPKYGSDEYVQQRVDFITDNTEEPETTELLNELQRNITETLKCK